MHQWIKTLVLGGALMASGLAISQDVAITKLPDGMVGIHYFRPDASYEGWGTHIWESFEPVKDGKATGSKSKSDAPLDGITWTSPMQPTGKDGAGVYWFVKADNFRNTKVNFIIHKGDGKDCTRDLAFFTTDTKEIFLNKGDCTMYKTADEAIKARK